MKKHVFSIVACSLVLLVLLPNALFADRNVKASGKITGNNTIPRIAVNFNTGDFIVVWTQLDQNFANPRIWVRLFKKKPNGKYSLKKPFMVSPDSGFHVNGFAAYVPWLDKFLVTWDTFNFTSLSPSPILGRFVKTKGKPTGKVRTIISDGLPNSWNRVLAFQREVASPAAVQNVLAMVYTAYPSSNDDSRSGLIYTRLTDKLKPTGKRKIVVPITLRTAVPSGNDPLDNSEFGNIQNQAQSSDFLTNGTEVGILYSENGDPFRAEFPALPVRNQYTWLLIDDPDTSVTGFFRDDSQEIRGIVPPGTRDMVNTRKNFEENEFGQTRMSMFVVGNFQAEFIDDIFDGDLDGYLLVGSRTSGSVDGAYLPRNYDNDIPGQNADLPIRRESPDTNTQPAKKKTFAQWIVNKGNKVVSYGLIRRNNGKVVRAKKEETRFGHGAKLNWLEAEGVPGTSTVVVAWQKFVSSGVQEIWVHIFE
ncbi:MAG: hypothetical protein MI702_05485 [Chlorobiales bacterium]|nr:hypothetical protein [Chlorobiales bacterium]